MGRVELKVSFINRILDRRGAALMTVMVLASIMAVILTASYILVRAQLAQANRVGLRLVAEKLNNSAVEILTQLLVSKEIELDSYEIPVGSGNWALTFRNAGNLSDASNSKVKVTAGNASNPTRVDINFCGDLTDTSSDIRCFSASVGTRVTLLQVSCPSLYCNLGIHVETQLMDVFRPNKAFKFSNEYQIGPFTRNYAE